MDSSQKNDWIGVMNKWLATIDLKLPAAPRWFPSLKPPLDPFTGEPVPINTEPKPVLSFPKG